MMLGLRNRCLSLDEGVDPSHALETQPCSTRDSPVPSLLHHERFWKSDSRPSPKTCKCESQKALTKILQMTAAVFGIRIQAQLQHNS